MVSVRAYKDQKYGPWIKLTEAPNRVQYAVKIQLMSEDTAEGHLQIEDIMWFWRVG